MLQSDRCTKAVKTIKILSYVMLGIFDLVTVIMILGSFAKGEAVATLVCETITLGIITIMFVFNKCIG